MRGFETSNVVDINLISDNRLKEYQFKKEKQLNDNYYMFSKVNDGYYKTIAVINESEQIPSHLVEWRKGKMKYQLRTIRGETNNGVFNDFTYWPNPKDNIPK
jgi:hypothetical protein